MTLGMVIAAVVAAMVILVSFFYAGVASKAAGDAFLASNPRATVAQLRKVLTANTPIWPSQLWQLHLAVGLPLVHAVDVVLNCFFYSVASHIWSQTFLSVRKLTPARWMALSWPLILSIVLHINFLFLTLLQRTALRSWSLGYVVELGQLTTVLDWYIFYTQTLPMMDGLSVAKVTLPATSKTADSSSSSGGAPNKSVATVDKKSKEARDRSRSRSRSRSRPRTMTMYTKTYAPPTVARSHKDGHSRDQSARSSYIDITSPTDHVNQYPPMPVASSPTGSRFATGHQGPRPTAARRDQLTIETHHTHRPRRPSRQRNDHLSPHPTSPAATYSNIGTELSQQALEALPPTSCSHLAIPPDMYSPPASPLVGGHVQSSDYARYHASGASRVRRRSRTGLDVDEAGVRGGDDRTTIVMDDPGPAGDAYGTRQAPRSRSQSATRHHHHLPIASQYQQRRPSADNHGYVASRRHQMPLPPLSPVVEQRTSPVSAHAHGPAPPRRRHGEYEESYHKVLRERWET
ncbi:hypothetical protein BCR44DRAFT_1442069 [Catenaria anguillulae PL171]|uniref:Uncharacterized protein n=1 Tax=Catenaria anguillulae PL171 TaxID=765915 RepID=A0A1Y2HCE2_9FUNG|nr:hypothetical protein BCR44DRAFT_1442069 [Catenaria anguillulae PL171]